MPEDVIINCSKDSKYPEAPEGHTWKEIRHDNTVTWLANWTEDLPTGKIIRYLHVDPSFKFKSEKAEMVEEQTVEATYPKGDNFSLI